MRNIRIEACQSEVDRYAISILQDQLRFRTFLYLNHYFKSDLVIVQVEKQCLPGRFIKHYRVVMSTNSEFATLFQEDQFIVLTPATIAVGAKVQKLHGVADHVAELLITEHQPHTTYLQRITL